MDLKANWYIGLISLAVWVSVSSGVEFVQLKSKMIRNWIDGKSTVLIKDGKILQDNLKKERLNSDELMMLPEEQAPQALIMDGHILEQTITAIGRDELWLKEELSKLGVRI
ncbi:YetF domain-containing protein [Paenibacillus apiarius]